MTVGFLSLGRISLSLMLRIFFSTVHWTYILKDGLLKLASYIDGNGGKVRGSISTEATKALRRGQHFKGPRRLGYFNKIHSKLCTVVYKTFED